MLTGRELESTRNRALQAGAIAFFQKPVEDGKLSLAIRKAMDLSAHLRRSSRMLSVLVIDDNVQLQIAFRKILIGAGYAVQLASDGEEGLRMALDKTPDIIVLDMLLPKLGGVEVLRALKRDPATKKTPVIALSGLPLSNEAKLRREGAVSYLEKSKLEDSEALLRAIDYALLLPRYDEFSQEAFLPNVTGPEKPSK